MESEKIAQDNDQKGRKETRAEIKRDLIAGERRARVRYIIHHRDRKTRLHHLLSPQLEQLPYSYQH